MSDCSSTCYAVPRTERRERRHGGRDAGRVRGHRAVRRGRAGSGAAAPAGRGDPAAGTGEPRRGPVPRLGPRRGRPYLGGAGFRGQPGRALLAHEAAHLAHRHVWWLLAAELAGAANPVLAPTVRAITHTVERWADEDAARAVTDRRLVARTLARTALLIRAAPAGPVGLTAVGGDVPERGRALLEPPPRPRVIPPALPGVPLPA